MIDKIKESGGLIIGLLILTGIGSVASLGAYGAMLAVLLLILVPFILAPKK